MKYFLFPIGFFVVITAINTRAEAQNYPWCAQYSYRDGATCGFTSFQQCMATVSGIGGFCQLNNLYVTAHRTPKSGRPL
jgi:hypothetical protein